MVFNNNLNNSSGDENTLLTIWERVLGLKKSHGLLMNRLLNAMEDSSFIEDGDSVILNELQIEANQIIAIANTDIGGVADSNHVAISQSSDEKAEISEDVTAMEEVLQSQGPDENASREALLAELTFLEAMKEEGRLKQAEQNAHLAELLKKQAELQSLRDTLSRMFY
jgi:hypothetical protein